ncbi:glucoamylase family protein [Candidatus Omnitrophota bacterium]
MNRKKFCSSRSRNIGFIVCVVFFLHIFTSPLVSANEDLLAKIEKDSINYFIKYAHPKTGLVPDSSMRNAPASISATGFSILALVIAAENGWLPTDEAYNLIKKTLFTLHNKVQHEKGFFYHFISTNSGKRIWNSEASSIDTALCIAGALVAGQYFKDTIIERLAQSLYERVEWDWMLNNSRLFCHGYKPESGFLPYYWDTYSEHLILQALGIGATKHAVPPECWDEWARLEDEYDGYSVIYAHSGSLFTYQFSHVFIDFRKLNDKGNNYYTNSKNAALANKAFCFNYKGLYKSYGDSIWGISASLGPRGYKAYGAKPGRGFHDGTIAPYSLLASLPFCKEEALSSIIKIYALYKEKIYGQCGFRDAFNLEKDWFAQQYIGIDQGVTIGMIENYRSEFVWKLFMELPAIQRWIERCNLKSP